jgi:hypothetical protein
MALIIASARSRPTTHVKFTSMSQILPFSELVIERLEFAQHYLACYIFKLSGYPLTNY